MIPAGTYTALIVEAFQALIDRQAAAGITGIVPVGTTGESATLSKDEHIEVIRLAVEHNAGRMKVIAGTGANATSPSQEGLYQHYKLVADNTSLPIMLYSIPGRSVIEITEETAARLANECENICCTKEAGGRPERVSSLREAVPEYRAGSDG